MCFFLCSHPAPSLCRLPNGLFLQVFGTQHALPYGGPYYLFAGADAEPATAGANLLVAPAIKLALTTLAVSCEVLFTCPFFTWSLYKPRSYARYASLMRRR